MFRVVIVNVAHDPSTVDPKRTLEAFGALREFAAGVRHAGARTPSAPWGASFPARRSGFHG